MRDGKPQTAGHDSPGGLGSLERFIGILVEHFAGAFPTWLAPVQARVIPVGENSIEYAGPGGGQAQGAKRSGSRWISATKRWGTRSGTPRCKRSRTCWSSGRERRRAAPWRCATEAAAIWEAKRWMPLARGSLRRFEAAAWTRRPQKALTGLPRVCYDRIGRVRAPRCAYFAQQTRCEEAASSSRSLASHLVALLGCSRGCRLPRQGAGNLRCRRSWGS